MSADKTRAQGSRDKSMMATAMRGDGKAGVKFSTPEDYEGVRSGGVGGGWTHLDRHGTENIPCGIKIRNDAHEKACEEQNLYVKGSVLFTVWDRLWTPSQHPPHPRPTLLWHLYMSCHADTFVKTPPKDKNVALCFTVYKEILTVSFLQMQILFLYSWRYERGSHKVASAVGLNLRLCFLYSSEGRISTLERLIGLVSLLDMPKVYFRFFVSFYSKVIFAKPGTFKVKEIKRFRL